MSATTYIITGATHGLGFEFVKQLSTNSIIFALARNLDNSKDLQELVKHNQNVHTVKLDLGDEASVKAAAEEVAKLAPHSVDILINNAGISGDEKPIDNLTITRKDYLRLFDINIFSVSDVIQAFVPLLLKRGQEKTKQIPNVSSAVGSLSLISTFQFPMTIIPAYVVSKTDLDMMTRLTADQLTEENFIVISVSPGWVRTDMGTENADISPEESVSGMLTHLGILTAKDNGLFYSYDSTAIPS